LSSPIKVTFLGTGTSQGVPVIACPCAICTSTDPRDNRLRSSILVETQGKRFVVDTGPDFRQQMLRFNPFGDVDAFIFTHEHKDHIAGLDDVRAYNFNFKKNVDVYAHPRVWKAFQREFPYIFEEPKYPGVPLLNEHIIGLDAFEIEGVSILPIEVIHFKLPVLGFRFGDFVYITDANHISKQEKEKIKGCKVLVLNALRHQSHISHFTFQEAIDLVNELKPEKAYFTHISHQLGLQEDMENQLPPNIRLAFDGLSIHI
jgi:phosphoribosyl 1,2-cyclic phosphate phosphodiesterase